MTKSCRYHPKDCAGLASRNLLRFCHLRMITKPKNEITNRFESCHPCFHKSQKGSAQIPKTKMLCVNSVQRRFQISDYKFFQSDTAPYESRKHSVAEISLQITTGPKCARTDYKHEGEKSEALEMCIRILLGPQKTCRQITKQNMLCPSMRERSAPRWPVQAFQERPRTQA